jgi:hypothetical protein
LKDFKPTVPISIKDSVSRISYITQTPVKDVAAEMIKHAINDANILSNLSLYFKRDLKFHNTLYIGRITNESIKKREQGSCERITTRLRRDDAELISALAYALDCTPTRVCAILLDASMKDVHFINNYVEKYLASTISQGQLQELKKLLQFVNRHNPKMHSWAAFLSRLLNEVSVPASKMKEAIKEFLSEL